MDEPDSAVGRQRPIINRIASNACATIFPDSLVHDDGCSSNVGSNLEYAPPVEVPDEKIEHQAIFKRGRVLARQSLAAVKCGMPQPCGPCGRKFGKVRTRVDEIANT